MLYSDLYYQTPGGLTEAEYNKDPQMARPPVRDFTGRSTGQSCHLSKKLHGRLQQYLALQRPLAEYAPPSMAPIPISPTPVSAL